MSLSFACAGHESCQQLRSSQTQAVLPQKSPTSVDIDSVTGPSEASPVNDNVDALDNEDKPQLIVDLRSEANIAAEVCPMPMFDLRYCM